MQKYNAALKEIAPFIAQNIFKDGQNYAKISLVYFSGLDSTELGTFYDEQSFTKALNKIKSKNSQTKMLNLSLIKAMSNFTKDNGLTKEIYLISNAKPSDMQNSQKVLTLTQNLNQNIVKNSKNIRLAMLMILKSKFLPQAMMARTLICVKSTKK